MSFKLNLNGSIWKQYYNHERAQSRFREKTPAEVRAEALTTDTPAQYPIPQNKRIQKYKARYVA